MKNINQTKTISDLLNTFTFGENSKGKSFSDTIKQSTVFSFWDDIVGKKLYQYTKPVRIKNSKLYVSAKSPVIIQELNLIKRKILKKLNTYTSALGISVVDIVFDYKNYNEAAQDNFPQDEKLEFYSDKDLSSLKIDDNYTNEIRNKISKINFLSDMQKLKLADKIINVKKADIKRKG